MDKLLARHIDACNNAVLPGGRLELRIGAARVGYVAPALARVLAGFDAISLGDGIVTLAANRADELPRIATEVADLGFGRVRGELFDVRESEGAPVLARIDRGALPVFGIAACGVHLNGLVRRADGVHVWVARRARDKLLDPGKLDHLVAGGISAGMDAAETLVKESAEEAGLPAELARRAVPTGVIRYAMDRDEGLRRDVLFCFDLDLPEDFQPRAMDGEVESFELWPAARLLQAVRETDDVKFNVNLVLIDLFQRLGLA
jgi:8-oxo-dGTP pyrophosphatase MutT (NUDIX family)